MTFVKALLEDDAEVNTANQEGEVPLHIECSEGDLSIVTELLLAGAVVNVADDTGRTPLHEASAVSYPLSADHLMDLPTDKSDASRRSRRKKLRREYYGKSGNPNTVKLVKSLVYAGADVNATNDRGETPLHLAYQSTSQPYQANGVREVMIAEIISTLIKAGADEHVLNHDGLLPKQTARNHR